MGENPKSTDDQKRAGSVAATLYAMVLFFFGVGMTMYPSREFMQGRIGDLEVLLLFLLWSRPVGILGIALGLYCGWLAIDAHEEKKIHRLAIAAIASAFGAFFGRIGFSGEGFAPSALRGAALVSLLAFLGVLVSRVTIFPLFAALVRLWKRTRRYGFRMAGDASTNRPIVGAAAEEHRAPREDGQEERSA